MNVIIYSLHSLGRFGSGAPSATVRLHREFKYKVLSQSLSLESFMAVALYLYFLFKFYGFKKICLCHFFIKKSATHRSQSLWTETFETVTVYGDLWDGPLPVTQPLWVRKQMLRSSPRSHRSSPGHPSWRGLWFQS